MFRTPIIILFLAFTFSQSISQVDTRGINSNIVLQDSTSDNDTIINKNGFFSLFKGKPGRAAFYSLIIPSGGQIYNRKWWKVPLALGIDGSLIYVVHWNTRQYKLSQADYLNAIATNSPNKSQIKLQRDYYQKYREYSWVWLIAGHLLTVVDAFVDRHLMEFDISDDLTFNLGTNEFFPAQTELKFKFNLNQVETKKANPYYPNISK